MFVLDDIKTKQVTSVGDDRRPMVSYIITLLLAKRFGVSFCNCPTKLFIPIGFVGVCFVPHKEKGSTLEDTE